MKLVCEDGAVPWHWNQDLVDGMLAEDMGVVKIASTQSPEGTPDFYHIPMHL